MTTPSRTGAVRADEPPHRRRGLWLLLALLAVVLLIALAIGLYLALRDDDSDSSRAGAAAPSASSTGSAPSASSQPAAAGTPGAEGGSTASAPSTLAGGGAGDVGTGTASSADGGLVGGGAIPPVHAAAGTRLAAGGAVGTVLFAEDSAVIDGRGRTVIADAVKRIRTVGAREVRVAGHTDVVGGRPVNSPLSEQRADRVAAALRQELGNSITVTTAALGEADPVQPNDTAAHRQFNRRATITLR